MLGSSTRTGGLVIPFTPGRVDHADELYWARTEMSYGRLPAAGKYCCPHLDDSNVASSLDPITGTVKGWEGLCTHVRNKVFYRMGFNDREIVALLSVIPVPVDTQEHGANTQRGFRTSMRQI